MLPHRLIFGVEEARHFKFHVLTDKEEC